MKALNFLKQERNHHLAIHNDKFIMEQYDEAIKEIKDYGIKKAMYENILSLIDIECKKQALSDASSYELKIFSKIIRDIILNNYITSIDMRKEKSND